jgi:putative phosphoesterase
MIRIGVISDTHGLLRLEAIAALRGADHIIHAGDIGSPDVLDALSKIAAVTAVRGNNDVGDWAAALPEVQTLQLGGVVIHVLHDLADVDVDVVAAGIQVVISGHSHKPSEQWRDGVLYLNPGSAGPRRFKLPVTAAELVVSDGAACARIVDLLSVRAGA